jgi:two-component system alkaline phosphatase synthesis response regulator PhoP
MAQRILIVEDESALVELHKFIFARSSFELFVASNGYDAVQLAREVRPELVLMDLMMPGMDGIEVCRQMHADPDLAGVRVIMLSSTCNEQIQQAARDAGALDYWTKPIAPRELRARVQAVLEQSNVTKALPIR